MKNQFHYQNNLLEKSPILGNADHKKNKVDKMMAILSEAGLLSGKCDIAVDVGCSVGFFCKALAPCYSKVYGLDIDSNAIALARKNAPLNVTFDVADSMSLPFLNESVDLVICNHVYEHVPDASLLFDEIYRILKPGGACYLGAASRLTVIEPHYHLPFLSWLPKFFAHRYMRLFNKGTEYYENLRTYWGIRKLVSKFSLTDFTLRVVEMPDRFCARDLIPVGGVVSKIPMFFWRVAYPFLPSYIFILNKQADYER